MCVADFDPPDFYVSTRRRCRAPFDCVECTARVERGEDYQRTTGKWEGTIETFKHCLACRELGEAVLAVDCSWAVGSLLDDAEHAVEQFVPFGDHAVAEPAAQGRLIGLLWRARERMGLAFAQRFSASRDRSAA